MGSKAGISRISVSQGHRGSRAERGDMGKANRSGKYSRGSLLQVWCQGCSSSLVDKGRLQDTGLLGV